MSFRVEPEPGRTAFFEVLEDSPQKFEILKQQVNAKWNREKDQIVNPEADKRLAAMLIGTFANACISRDVVLTDFFNEEVKVRIAEQRKNNPNGQTSEASAVVRTLWLAEDGRIRRPQTQLDQQKSLAPTGEAKLDQALKAPEMRATLQKAATQALISLNEAHQVDAEQFVGKEKEIARQFRMKIVNSVKTFIHTVFPAKSDSEAVDAFWRGKFFVRYCFSREFYINYGGDYSSVPKDTELFIYGIAKKVSPDQVLALPPDPEMGRRLFNHLITVPNAIFDPILFRQIIPLFQKESGKIVDEELFQKIMQLLIGLACSTEEQKSLLIQFIRQEIAASPNKSQALLEIICAARLEGKVTRTQHESVSLQILARIGNHLLDEISKDKQRKPVFDAALKELSQSLDQKVEGEGCKCWDLKTHQWVDAENKGITRPGQAQIYLAEKDLSLQALSAFAEKLFPDDKLALKAHFQKELFHRYGYSYELYLSDWKAPITGRIKDFFTRYQPRG